MIYSTVEVKTLKEYLSALKTHHPSAISFSTQMEYSDTRHCLMYCEDHKDNPDFPQYSYVFHSKIVSDYYRGYSKLSFKEVFASVKRLLEIENNYSPVYGVLINFFNFHGRLCLRDGKKDIHDSDIILRDKYYEKAVAVGDPFAQMEYCEILLIEDDTDFQKLLSRYETLGKIDFKYASVCYGRVGEMYFNGRNGVSKNPTKAYFYLSEAVRMNPNSPARRWIDKYLEEAKKQIEG